MRFTFIVIFIANAFCTNILAQSSTLIVTATNDVVNGNTTSPATLKDNPGPDGISLREAILATNSVPGPHTIIFDLTLKGKKIIITENLPTITKGQISIVGDVDGDSKPDITFESINASICFQVSASDVTISGFTISNFSWSGIEVITGQNGKEPKVIERIVLEGNEITGSEEGITISNSDQFCTISDVEIRRNTIIKNSFGINIQPAWFQSGWERLSFRNQIVNVKVTNNFLSNNLIAVYATGAIREGSKDNLISGLIISDNNISGTDGVQLLVVAANSTGSQNNKIENLTICNNIIDGLGTSIEIVGGAQSGDDNMPSLPMEMATDVRGNIVSDIKIIGNTIRGGGIQFVGAYGSKSLPQLLSFENYIVDVVIGWNIITRCSDSGILLISGSSGATKNKVERITILNNLIAKNNDGGGIVFTCGFEGSPNNIIDDVTIINNTICDNGTGRQQEWAGGICLYANNQSIGNQIYNVKITNTILWANAGNDYIRGTNSPEFVHFSIIGDPRYKNNNGNFYTSPLFVSSENFDFRLEKLSPAIDLGDPNTTDAGNTDFLGNIRIVDGNNDGKAIIDIGAIEYNPINGNSSVCSGNTEIYIASSAGATSFAWTVPSDWTITSGQGTSSITVKVGNNSGNVCATPSNSYGNGSQDCKSVTVTALPTAIISYVGSPFCKTVGAGQPVTLTGTPGGTYTAAPAGLTFDGVTGAINPSTSTAGTYTVTYTIAAAGGCGAVTATTSVTFISKPSLATVNGNSPVCSGNTEIYTASSTGATSFTWTVPSNWTITSGQGTSSIKVTVDSNSGNVCATPSNCSGNGSQGCKTVQTAGVIPKIIAKWGDVLICSNLGDSITNFQWYKGSSAISGATKQYYETKKQTGAYKVEIVDINGCKNSSNPISISGTKSLSVYPNPSSVSFALKLNDESEGRAIVRVLNSSGIKVMEFQTENMNDELLKEIPVKNLSEGIYVVQVLLDNKDLYYTKIVVIK